jgi:hypothetical protein
VSIPKGKDFGLLKLHNNIHKYIRSYTYEGVTFYAPTIDYQLLDLHDLLFKQNEYPWLDIKYAKRITRYFLTIVLYDIIEHIGNNKNVKQTLLLIKESFEAFTSMLIQKSSDDKPRIVSSQRIHTKYMLKLAEEYKGIHAKVKADPTQEKHFFKFSRTLNDIFVSLTGELDSVAYKLTEQTTKRIQRMYAKIQKGQTNVL